MYLIGAATTGVFGFIYFALLNTMVPGGSSSPSMLSLIPHDMMYGPQAALIAECFTGRLRYSGASIGYQLASIIAGGPAPLIAGWLFAGFDRATRSRSISRLRRHQPGRGRPDAGLHRQGYFRRIFLEGDVGREPGRSLNCGGRRIACPNPGWISPAG